MCNSVPNDKILDWSKLKASADDNEKLNFSLGKLEKIVGKGENADYQHFLLFPQYFQKLSIFRIVTSRASVLKS